ncbi:hypothetical protein LMH87_011046 [Akanthomyces muscarius]|uniref:Uncharacterized protein n=1 Tax=Akanthomyces muscarius TaxID=2231603 RepID=A0A9W8UKD2_AKAMU|nr:hypothetical protein LMH87_011046 [Akanthomyces muscarius]KAJ4150289.1 hypothetical protein LMH87_011046 [Akanthomyces muscarius]
MGSQVSSSPDPTQTSCCSAASTRTQALDDPIEKEFVPKKMMTSNRPRDTLSLPSSSSKASSSSATGSVTAGDSLHLLYKELSSVVDREPAQPGNAEGETNDGSILCDPRATISGNTATNVMIVKTIRAAMAEIRRP